MKNRLIQTFYLFFLISCYALLKPHSILAANYYVATNGNDSNIGSLESPWRTIQHAINHLGQGDDLFIRGGTYNESINIDNLNGFEDNYTVITNYNNEHVIIDGYGKSGSVIKTTYGTETTIRYIKFDGLEIMRGSQAGITLSGKAAGTHPNPDKLANTRDIIISNCNIHDNVKSGINIYYETNHITIENNNIHHNGRGENYNCTGNTHEGHGVIIYLYYQGRPSQGGFNVENGSIIRGNSIHDNGCYYHNFASGIEVGYTPNSGIIIEDNDIYGNVTLGIDLCKYTSKVLVRNNKLHHNLHCGVGIDMGANSNTIYRNFIHNNGMDYTTDANGHVTYLPEGKCPQGYCGWGGGLHFWMSDPLNDSYVVSNNLIINNTIIDNYGRGNSAGGIRAMIEGSYIPEDQRSTYVSKIRDNIVVNNIISNNNAADFSFNQSHQISSSNYNLYGPEPKLRKERIYNSPINYTSLSAFYSATSYEKNSLSGDPLFVNPNNSNYQLRTNSPAIDAGLDNTFNHNLSLNFTGTAPDIGAFEFSGEIISSPTPTPQPPPPPQNLQYTVKKASSPLTIDGNLSEFTQVEAINLQIAENSTKAIYKLLWDDSYLYIGMQALDSDKNAEITDKDGNIWQDDSLEIMIDPQLNQGNYLQSDDLKYYISYNGTIRDSKGGDPSWDTSGEIISAIINTDTGYNIEAKIPWDGMELNLYPDNSTIHGFNINLNDRISNGTRYDQDWANIENNNVPDDWGNLVYSNEIIDIPQSPTPTTSPTPDQSFSIADLNYDHQVDNLDYEIMLSNWGAKAENIPANQTLEADINFDGLVDGLDYIIFFKEWNSIE